MYVKEVENERLLFCQLYTSKLSVLDNFEQNLNKLNWSCMFKVSSVHKWFHVGAFKPL